MTKKQTLVMATNNAGKLREARAIAGDRIEILSLADVGFHDDIPETADTLSGNALIKARAVKKATGHDCFADDTGLIVDALGGAPGVYSARYAGEACDPEANMDLLLKNLEGAADRSARFKTCIALTLGEEEHLFEGSCEGSIAKERSGSHGFGYDPVFVSAETGMCFAEMSDEAKNAISHRGRALRAMLRWLGTLGVILLCALPCLAAFDSGDWKHYNTFDDKTENVFDTPDKTYFLVQAQYYDSNPTQTDNAQKLCFLFTLDKETDEVLPYNAQNHLSHSLIRIANYNALKRYLMIVYDDHTIDILHDDGKTESIAALKNYLTSGTKEVRGISFAPELNQAYLATDFGFFIIDDEKLEVASSGIYNTPIDRVVRAGDRLLILKDGKLLQDALSGTHISLSDFKDTDWAEGCEVTELASISPDMCMFAKKLDGTEQHYILTFEGPGANARRNSIGSFQGASIAENRDGLLLTRLSQLVEIDRRTGERTFLPRRGDDYNVPCGSWDLRDVFFAKSRVGFYSLRRSDDNSYTVTREPARPDAPAAFRSNSLVYTRDLGLLVNTHGTDHNFDTHTATNPILLSAFKDGGWDMYGFPYLMPDEKNRIYNPCGLARDPDNPDQFYFGSVSTGLLRYDITGKTSIMHMTRSTDNPTLEGHVSVIEPYEGWKGSCMLLYPRFDTAGNLVIAHINTTIKNNHTPELWIWTAEDRKASTTPETFKPFKRFAIKDLKNPTKHAQALPLTASGRRNMIVYAITCTYGAPFTVYDHNGTIDDESDDRQAPMENLYDQDGSVSCLYIYCMLEDPATGLVWVGTDNGVFTFNPADAFTSPGKVNRIKVSRNDGTSLADYLLNNVTVNNISIDGQGRKWFSLASGGVVCTSADGKTILNEFNTENSMLPDDNVYATCYNPDNNTMVMATSAGICQYYLGGQAQESSDSGVKAYPNPVRPDYYGYVTIEGLEEESLVKIADSAGNIVRELGPAPAGRVQWDVCGMDLNRVPSGVYFVLASSGAGGGSYSEVSKILVINR